MQHFVKQLSWLLHKDSKTSIHKLIADNFDNEFYLQSYPDVKASRLDPVLHFINTGHDTGCDPSPSFSTKLYLQRYPDVAASGMNSFAHYLKFGRHENRNGSPAILDTNSNQGLDIHTSDCDGVSEHLLTHFGLDDASTGDRSSFDIAELNIRGHGFTETDLLSTRSEALHGNGGGDPGYAPDLHATETVPGEDLPGMPDGQVLTEKVLSIGRGKVLSFDVWDTLLRRDCAPDAVKLRNARAVWLTGFSASYTGSELHPIDLFQLRRQVEAEVADDAFEYRLTDVAALLPGKLGIGNENFAETFLAREMAIEKHAITADPVMAGALQRHVGHKLAISDFYMGREQLGELLESVGLDQFDGIYASCDHMATKRRGDLFARVLDAENLAASQVLHVGDRYEADYVSARKQGLGALHYHSPSHQPRLEELERAFWAHVDGDSSLHGKAILKALQHDPLAENRLELIAVAATGFVLQVLETALRMKVPTVFFCTREGVFFRDIYDLLVQRNVFDLDDYPASALLEVSRKATFAASLDDFSNSELMRLWSQYSTQSVNALAGTLNIDPALLAVHAARAGLVMDKDVTYPWADAAFAKFVSNPAVQAIAREAIWEQRTELLAYLQAAGFDPHGKCDRLIVDIGWRGTIQDNLARMVEGSVAGCYFGLERYINVQAHNVSKRGYVMDANCGEPLAIPEVAGLEFLFNAPGGSTTGYRDGTAIREIIADEEALVTGVIAAFQRRLLAAAATVADYVRRHGLISTDIKGLSREIIADFCQRPPREVADAFYELSHNESFGIATVVDMAFDQSALDMLPELDAARLHSAALKFEKEVRWHGAWRRTSSFAKTTEQMSAAQKLHLPAAPAIIRPGSLGRDKIAVLSPAPILGSGGHRTIFNLAGALARQGYDVHLMHESAPDHQTAEWIGQILGNAQLTEHAAWLNWISPKASVATIWYSAFYQHEFWNQAEPFYFVQDVEAAFNPVGDTFMKAQRSYSLGASHICVGRWLPHALRGQYGIGVASGGLGLDHDVYHLDPTIKREQQVALLFQPEKSRRAPQLCIEALAIVKQRLPETRIVLYGSNNYPHLPFGHEHLGLITDVRQINALYNRSAVGLCVSSTNPSRIPFEMMAAGCVPVDVFRYNNLFDYDAECGLLAHDSPESIAQAICDLLTENAFRQKRSAAGLASVADRSLAWEMDAAINAIAWRLEGGDFDKLPSTRPTYSDAPVIADVWKTPPVQRGLAWERQLASHLY